MGLPAAANNQSLHMSVQSFLPAPFAHRYEIDPKFSRSAAYFSCEFAIDQSFKIYSGGLGFLAGSHMRSAADLRQNLTGIGILWTYGYYNQVRGEDGEGCEDE
jgi:starch phosphorylase